MTFRQRAALPNLLNLMNKLTNALYPYDFTEGDLLDITLNTYDMFLEDYTAALDEVADQTAEIKEENADLPEIADLATEILEHINYMRGL